MAFQPPKYFHCVSPSTAGTYDSRPAQPHRRGHAILTRAAVENALLPKSSPDRIRWAGAGRLEPQDPQKSIPTTAPHGNRAPFGDRVADFHPSLPATWISLWLRRV